MSSKVVCLSIDILMVVIYVVMGLLFINSKGKACHFIAGYNMKDQQARKTYDEVKISNYFGKTILSWSVYFVIGATVDCFMPGVGVSLAFALFVIALLYHVIYINSVFDKKFKLSR